MKPNGTFVRWAMVWSCALPAGGCKTETKSRLRTVDNFTREDVNTLERNTCGKPLKSVAEAPFWLREQPRGKRQLGKQQLGKRQLGTQQLGTQQLGTQQLGKQQLGDQRSQSGDDSRAGPGAQDFRPYVQRIEGPTEPLLATLGVLAEVPAALASPFFFVGGRILLVPDAAEKCAALSRQLSPAEKRFAREELAKAPLLACWQQARRGDYPVIYLQGESAVIQHSLIRILAYFYTEFVLDRFDSLKGNEEVAQAIAEEFRRFDPQLDPRHPLRLYDRLLQQLASAVIEDAPKGAKDRLKSFSQSDPVAFRRFALAEVLDSRYCADPRAQEAYASSQFTRTRAAFDKLQPLLGFD